MNAALFIPLAANVFEEALTKATAAIGKSVLNNLSLTATAIGFAACFVIFRLIQTINDIEADDNAGGLGHVKLWDIVRPLIFFMLVSASPSVVDFIDRATTTVTAGINTNASKISNGGSGLDYYISTKWSSFTSNAEEIGTRYKDNKGERSGTALGRFFSNTAGAAETVADPQTYDNIYNMFTSFWSIITRGWPLAIAWIVKQIMMLARTLFLILSKINIVLIKLFAPFMLALSILEPWKNNYQKLIANLLYFELWAPILSILTVICNGMLSLISSSYVVTTTYINGHLVKTVYGEPTYLEMFAYIIVVMACLAIILQTPAISNAVINMGSTHDAHDTNAASKMLGRVPGLGKVV